MRVQGFTVTRLGSERGIALITTLLVMMLMSALLVGFTTVVMSDQRYRLIDRDRVRSFYAAQSGLEKLNVDLTNLFLNNVAPTAAQIATLKDNPPVIPDVTFVADGSSAAYGVREEPPPFGCPNPCSLTISTGPYAGLIALKKIYRLDATARTADGGETHLVRKVETVAIPVFQFGMFSDMDLSFHAGPTFDFGGRVHTNGNLFLAQGNGATLWLREKVTAVKEVVRKRIANGVDIPTSDHEGTVKMATAPGAFRDLLDTEGSVQDMPPTPLNNSWPSISLGSYNSYIRNGLTGAKPLNLPLLTTGGSNADLIRRPAANEASTNPDLLGSRYFNNVSLRILLSDRAADIMSLPTVVQSSQPVSLDGNWRTTPPAGYNGATGVDATHAPVARSPGNVLVGGNLPQVIATTGAAPNMTISVRDPAGAGVPLLPRGYRVRSTAAPQYYALTVTSGANAYQVTCSGRTTVAPLQFTGCITSPTPLLAVPLGATVTAVLDNDTVVSTTIAGLAWAAPFTTMRVNATAAFQPNTFAVTVTRAGQAGSPWTVHCSGKTATTLTGCIPQTVPAATVNSAGATVRANVATAADGNLDVPVATQQGLGANWAAPWTTITLSGTASMAYATNTFWVLNGDGSNALVTCTGYSMPNTLTGCNVSAGGTVTANAQISSAALSNAGTGLIGGFIKIEMQDANETWRDVTLEILSYGISAPNQVGRICDPSPNAIVRIQRLRDNAESGVGACSYLGTMMTTDFIPNTLFDAREALYRDPTAAPPATDPPLLGGVIHYVTIDVRNLSDWLEGTGPANIYAAGSGRQALNNEGRGFSVYFSDRRNNRNTLGQETGEYGFEDIINPNSANGDPSGGLPDPGEDVNASGGNVETYGQIPAYYDAAGVFSAQPPGAVAPLNSAARTRTAVRAPFAMVNRAILFRRAVKLTNGGLGDIIMPGLTVSAENPVYIQGSWNANSSAANEGALGEPNAATSIVADALTLLTDNWSDWNSFRFPYAPGSRGRTNDSYYRFAVIAGKNKSFARPTVGTTPTDFGSDGGAHNFLRMLEGGGQSVHYRGSIASFFYSRQAVGVYKCCQAVYGAPPGPGGGVPGRNFAFDTDFLDPSLLPPLTPVFRDTNSLGFAQEVRPGK